MTMGRQAWLSYAALMGALLAPGCGGNAESTEVASGNTNWLKECTTDGDCGDLNCVCGTCRHDCGGVIACALEPKRACLGGEDSDPPNAEPSVVFEDVNPDAYANDLAIDADASIVLVGGTDFFEFDSSPSYPTFWLAKLDAEGSRLWEYTEPPPVDDAQGSNTGLSLALTGGGEIVALSTIYDGVDTPSLRRFDAEGSLLANWTSAPGFTMLSSTNDERFLAAGSRLNETRAGRPYASAWIGRMGADAPIWEADRTGIDGSISDVDAIASDGSGQLVVGGSLGTAPDSNASLPWLARLDQDGAFVWEELLEVSEASDHSGGALGFSDTNCNATAVAFRADGGSLASTSCVGPWVRAYDDAGQVEWERRFAKPVTALAGLSEGGYVVALGMLELYGGAPGATLLRYDAEHRLLWRAEQTGCYRFERVVATERGVLALAGCDTGYRLTSYADP